MGPADASSSSKGSPNSPHDRPNPRKLRAVFDANRREVPQAATISDILRCFGAGQVARTDGRELLRAELFEEWTFENLHRRHGDDPVSLFDNFKGKQYSPSWSTLGELCARITERRDQLPDVGTRERAKYHGVVNVKRLGEKNAIREAFTRHFASSFSFLWVGISTNNLHCDEFNNVLIQVSGRKQVLVFSPEASNEISRSHFVWMKNHKDVFAQENIAEYPELARVPWHLETLNPGDALVIPSGAYHAVIGLEPNTTAVNAFLAPRLRNNHLGPHSRKYVPLPWWLINLGIRISIHAYRLTGHPLFRAGHYEVM